MLHSDWSQLPSESPALGGQALGESPVEHAGGKRKREPEESSTASEKGRDSSGEEVDTDDEAELRVVEDEEDDDLEQSTVKMDLSTSGEKVSSGMVIDKPAASDADVLPLSGGEKEKQHMIEELFLEDQRKELLPQLTHPTPSQPVPPPQSPVQAEPALHLSIRLMDVQKKAPIPWGSVVKDQRELAIVMHNPQATESIRMVCHVCNSQERRLPVNGKTVLDLQPKASAVMCRFRADAYESPVQLHFLAATLPLIPGRPLYHTRLFVNISVSSLLHGNY